MLTLLNGFAALWLLATSDSSTLLATEKIEARSIAAHIDRLASDEFGGRAPGTPGEALTIQYLATQFEQSGLEPGNPDGSYFQKVPLVGHRSLPKIEIEAGGRKLDLKFLDEFVHDRVALQARALAN